MFPAIFHSFLIPPFTLFKKKYFYQITLYFPDTTPPPSLRSKNMLAIPLSNIQIMSEVRWEDNMEKDQYIVLAAASECFVITS